MCVKTSIFEVLKMCLAQPNYKKLKILTCTESTIQTLCYTYFNIHNIFIIMLPICKAETKKSLWDLNILV